MDYLSLCLYVKDEDEDYLHEWVDYHTLLGVERFFIYDNESRVSVREILAEEVAGGRVIVIDAPGTSGQQTVYAHCLHYFGAHTRWLGFIDADEFIVPKTTTDVRTFLTDYEGYGGLGIHWVIFGSSGHIEKPVGTQIENYTLAAPPDFQPNHSIKSIVQTQYAVYPARVHYFFYRAGYYVINEDYVQVIGFEIPRVVNKIQLNHYFTRSQEHFEIKIKRGQSANEPPRTMNDFYAYDNPSKIKDNHIINLTEKILQGENINLLHLSASIVPLPPKIDFTAPSFSGTTHTQIEARILEEIVRAAIKNNDLAVLTTIYDVATWRFSSAIWSIDWFIQTVNILWDYCIKMDTYDNAMRFLNKAISQNPEEPSFQMRYALYLHANGDLNGAGTVLKAVLSRNSRDMDALVSLGKLCYDKGNLDEALNYLKAALDINPTDQDVQDGLAMVIRMKERREYQGRVN